MTNDERPLQLELSLLLAGAAPKIDRKRYARTATWKREHLEKEIAMQDRNLLKWRAELSVAERKRAAYSEIEGLKALLRDTQRNRRKACKLMANLVDSIRNV
jgi:hypothetical protein